MISPNGRWIAYTSLESGAWHVRVGSFGRGASERRRASPGRGQEPVWAHSGRQLFYRSSANELMAVQVREGPTIELGTPTALFSMEPYLGSDGRAQFDVDSGDERFLMLKVQEGADVELARVEGFAEELPGRPRG